MFYFVIVEKRTKSDNFFSSNGIYKVLNFVFIAE